MKLSYFISDIHSHYHHLYKALQFLCTRSQSHNSDFFIPENVEIYFGGDFWDRGSYPVETLNLIMDLHERYPSQVFSVLGNHCYKWKRYFNGNNVILSEEQEETFRMVREYFMSHCTKSINQGAYDSFIDRAREFYNSLPMYLIIKNEQPNLFDGKNGDIVLTHAYFNSKNLKSENKTKHFMYGLTTGKKDENGHPIRTPWQNRYDGKDGKIIFGHIGLDKAKRFEHAVCIDSSVFRTGILSVYESTNDAIIEVCL
jgi:hypothetical protein